MLYRNENNVKINPRTDILEFQIVDWRAYDYRNFSSKNDDENDDAPDGHQNYYSDEEENKTEIQKKYLIEIYGFDKQQNSVCLTVEDFTPYFFVEIPSHWTKAKFQRIIQKVATKVESWNKEGLHSWKIVDRMKFYGFRNEEKYKFVRLAFLTKGAFYSYQKQLSEKITVPGIPETICFKGKFYEANIDPMLRFMHLRDIDPAGWVTVDIKNYQTNMPKRSKCNIDASCHWKKVSKSQKNEIGRLRILSFDIECTSQDGSFPKPERAGDEIIQIGSTCHEYGSKECNFKHIVTLGKSTPVEGAVVESYANEKDLLVGWAKLIEKYDPDIITGYNIFGFDWEYIYKRAKLGMGNNKKDYSEYLLKRLSRSKEKPASYVEKTLSSSALGDNVLKYIDCPGRVPIDVFKVVQKDAKLDSYKLDHVAEHFLKIKKIDLKPYQIFEKYVSGTPQEIGEIAEYCIRDCELCNKLIIKLEIIANNMGMGNVCSVPLSYLFLRGQGVKIFSLVSKQCQKEGYLIDVVEKTDDDNGYEGAIVFTPTPGIYMDPITILDYGSLYPSSMISENISHDTEVVDKKYLNLPDYNYNRITYDVFEGKGDDKKKVGEETSVFAERKNGEKGVLPRILMHLLKARKDTRRKIVFKNVVLKPDSIIGTALGTTCLVGEINATDDGEFICKTNDKSEKCYQLSDENKKGYLIPIEDIESIEDTYTEFEKAVFDGLQLAYKITANSVYGQTGAPSSKIKRISVAASTTATGRSLVILARDKITEKFVGTKSIYGDTDSVFLNFVPYIESKYGKDLTDEEKLQKSFELGIEAQNFMGTLLKYPHKCEYEKIFWPFIILRKKGYAGNKYEFNMKKFKQTSMGIVLKRRDNAQIVKDIYGGIINKILNERNPAGAKQLFKDEVAKLLSGDVDISLLIVSKSLSGHYANPTQIAHKVLADRMGERDSGNKPHSNDRIPFCYIEASELSCAQCHKKKLNSQNCKCIKCMKLYCSSHLGNHRDMCQIICRFCRRPQENNSNVKECLTCHGWYCSDDMVLHKKRTDKYKVVHYDKCKKDLPTKLLQGDIIEHPEYIKENNIKIDYRYYLDHQIMTPCLQILELMMPDPESLVRAVIRLDDNKKNGNQNIEKWFQPITNTPAN